METPSDYVNDIKDISQVITGSSASHTGQYYRNIYSEYDSPTNVPTLNVELQSTENTPTPLNNLTDAQILEIVKSKGQVARQATSTNTPVQEIDVTGNVVSDVQNYGTSNDAELPIMGIFILVLLLILVGFVYFIIRIWQDHQAQKMVMTSVRKKKSQDIETPIEEAVEQFEHGETAVVPSGTEYNWRSDIEAADKKLTDLLEQKGIVGETVSDKLKNVGSGQFASIDLAWEAHQSAKNLLTAHDDAVDEQQVNRTLQLFKQVFTEHGV